MLFRSDGAFDANDLIKPPSYGGKIVKSGNLSVKDANDALSQKITGLQPGASYVLSAVLVDARDDRSTCLLYTSLALVVFHIRAGKPLPERFTQHSITIYTHPVILDFNDDFASRILSGQCNFPHRILACVNPHLLVRLDAVIHGIAHDMHNRVADRIYDRLVDLRILPDDAELRLTAQLLPHVSDNPAHFLERPRYWNHAQRHRDILQLICQLAQLAGGFIEVIQFGILDPAQRCV